MTRNAFYLLVVLVGWVSDRAWSRDCQGAGSPLSAEFRGQLSSDFLETGDEFTCTFSILSNQDVQGFQFLFDFDEEAVECLGVTQLYQRPDGEPFERQTVEINSQNNVPSEVDGGGSIEEGFVKGDFYFSSTSASFDLPASQETPVLELRFRVRPDTPERSLELGFRDSYAPEGVTWLNSTAACGVESHAGQGLQLYLETTNLHVPGECPSLDLLEGSYVLGDALSPPGSVAMVPFKFQGTGELQSYSISIDFDESVLQLTQLEMAYHRADGKPWAFEKFFINNRDDIPGSSELDEGFLTGAVVFSFDSSAFDLPANQETTLLDLHFAVRPETEAVSTEVKFLDFDPEKAEALGLYLWANTIAMCGQTAQLSSVKSFVFVNGVIGIIDEISIFIRGDSNGDERVNISDASRTLAYLFYGGDRPVCYDAADANDDGTIDVSDAITTLHFLFVGSENIPSPSMAPGEDPTPDSLRCVGKSD